MSEVDSTLGERGSRYGSFDSHSVITQSLKDQMYKCPKWAELPAHMKESLEMIMHKVGRILNGDPTYADSWHDIAGYAILVEKILEGKGV